MDYAKKAALNPVKREDPSERNKSPSKRSEEQNRLLHFIKTIRTGSQSTSQPQRWIRPPARQKVSYLGKLSEKLSELKIKEEETTEEKVERLRKTLFKLESPMIWKPIYKRFTSQDESLISKLHEKDNEIVDEKKFKWRNFILRLVISYELYYANRNLDALEAVLDLEKTLVDNEENTEWLFLGIKEALWHVVQASKAFLLFEQHSFDEADQSLDHVQSVRTMRRSSRAGIHGIKAAVFMEYGHEGNKRALPVAKQALELDRSCAEWHFLVGKCMGRIRRVANCHDKVDPLEQRTLNKANDLDKENPLYRIYLAQIIRERSFRNYKTDYPSCRSDERQKIEKAYHASYYKYLEAKEMRPNCPHILIRCAYGLMKFPFQYVNLKLVRECLDKAIELAPNNQMAHHIKGLFLERFDVDAEAALKEITTAAALGNFGASMDLVRMRYRLNKGDPVKELKAVAEMFAEPACVQVAYTQLASYFLFVKFYLVEAIQYFTKVIDIDMQSYAMKSHKSLFLRCKDPVNLFEVLLEELDKNTNWGTFSKEDCKLLKRFRVRILEHDTPENRENRLTVVKLLELSKNIDQEDQRKWVKLTKKRDKWSWNGQVRLKRKIIEAYCKKSDQKRTRVGNNKSYIKKQKAHGNLKTQSDKEVRRSRSRSVTSVSSVDSDYERDSGLHGPRGFFVNDKVSASDSNESASVQPRDSSTLGRFSEHSRRLRGCHSRDSSVCSMSSDEHLGGRPSVFQNQTVMHNSSMSDVNVSSKTENTLSQVSLTVENLKLFDSTSAGCLRPQKPSVTSMDEEFKRLSVMDRVKQSYAMLNRGDQSEKKNLRRSESTKSLNKRQYKMEGSLTRSDSTQSLNVEVESLTKRLERHKPFGSKDSNVGSGRSFSFLPSFASKGNK